MKMKIKTERKGEKSMKEERAMMKNTMNQRKASMKSIWIAASILVSGGLATNALAAKNDMTYNIHVPILIDNFQNIRKTKPIKGDRNDSLEISCVAFSDKMNPKSFRGKVPFKAGFNDATVKVGNKNTLRTSVTIPVKVTYHERVDLGIKHFKCKMFIGTLRGAVYRAGEGSGIDRSKSVFEVTGDL